MADRRSDPFSESEITSLRDFLAKLDEQETQFGSWTSKIDARQTGFSLHIKFANKGDAVAAMRVAGVFDQAPVILYSIIDRVLGQIEAAATEGASV